MALRSDLNGLGLPTPLAALMGDEPLTAVTCVGTAQVGAAGLVLGYNNLVTSVGQTACVMPSTMAVGERLVLFNTTATAALLFPVSGGNINAAGANASVSIAQNKPTIVERISATAVIALIGA